MVQPVITGPAIPRRLPDFFLVGHMKSGTTALHAMLRTHPGIFMPAFKEPDFFASELRGRGGRTIATLDAYAALFDDASAEQLVGEASASYLWSRTAAPAIAATCPDARIIAVFREPATFLYSLYLELVQCHQEYEGDFARALALEPSRRRGLNLPNTWHAPEMLFYSDHVRYAAQLARFEAAFSRDRLLALIYDDFRRDNQATLSRIFTFLGVEPTFSIAARDANPTVRVRSRRLNDALWSLSTGTGPASARALKRVLKMATPERFRRRVLDAAYRNVVFAPPEPPDEAVMSALRRQYRPEVEALSQFLGRDLVAFWGYDRV